jgi:hypothetical protein
MICAPDAIDLPNTHNMYPYISKLILNILTKIILSTGYNS